MIFKETDLSGAFVIEAEPISDDRGFFSRVWCKKEFEEHGLDACVLQCNMSYNLNKGTLRGMHFQRSPYSETKYIRCVKGAFYDVIIDLREDSKTYGKWFGIELSEQNKKGLYVPKGFAHGFQTLEDDTYVYYQVTEFYTPEAESGIRWNDPKFNIIWPNKAPIIITDKDNNWPLYKADPQNNK